MKFLHSSTPCQVTIIGYTSLPLSDKLETNPGFQAVKRPLIVCEVSVNWPKIIYPNGTKSVIKDRALKRRSKAKVEQFWKMILLPNMCQIYSKLFIKL